MIARQKKIKEIQFKTNFLKYTIVTFNIINLYTDGIYTRHCQKKNFFFSLWLLGSLNFSNRLTNARERKSFRNTSGVRFQS